VTAEAARAIAERRTLEHLQCKEAHVTHEVEVIAKLAIKVRVNSADGDPEELAMEQATGMLPQGCEVLDQFVHRTRSIPARPVRTVMMPRHIGDGCYNDEGADL
jgi:hypothetical protein